MPSTDQRAARIALVGWVAAASFCTINAALTKSLSTLSGVADGFFQAISIANGVTAALIVMALLVNMISPRASRPVKILAAISLMFASPPVTTLFGLLVAIMLVKNESPGPETINQLGGRSPESPDARFWWLPMFALPYFYGGIALFGYCEAANLLRQEAPAVFHSASVTFHSIEAALILVALLGFGVAIYTMARHRAFLTGACVAGVTLSSLILTMGLVFHFNIAWEDRPAETIELTVIDSFEVSYLSTYKTGKQRVARSYVFATARPDIGQSLARIFIVSREQTYRDFPPGRKMEILLHTGYFGRPWYEYVGEEFLVSDNLAVPRGPLGKSDINHHRADQAVGYFSHDSQWLKQLQSWPIYVEQLESPKTQPATR